MHKEKINWWFLFIAVGLIPVLQYFLSKTFPHHGILEGYLIVGMNPYLPFITYLLILFIICIAFKLERKFLRGYSHTVVYVLSVVTLLFLFLYSYLFPVRYVSTGTPRRYVDYSISQYKQASVFNVYYGLFLNVLNTLIFVAFFIVNFPYRSFKGSNYSR